MELTTLRKLIFYPNYSMGGVTSVIRGRAASEPETKFDVVFLQERGGDGAFDDFPNVDVRVCPENRIENFLKYRTARVAYDEISVLSHPQIANLLTARPDTVVTYEFHSSDLKVISKEISELEIGELSGIGAPSETMVEQIAALLPKRFQSRVRVIPNLVDSTAFYPEGSHDSGLLGSRLDLGTVPLIWVGRFDEGKGYRYFLRLLAQLPREYFGVVIVSLENDPQRSAKFFSEATAMEVVDRVRLFSNLSRNSVANLYYAAREAGGWLVSTSMMESFGYSVAEALTCGLRVAAFELPAFEDFKRWDILHLIDIGSVSELASLIQGSTAKERQTIREK